MLWEKLNGTPTEEWKPKKVKTSTKPSLKFGVWCVAVALFTLVTAGEQNDQPANEPAPATSIYSIELRDKNFDNLTNGELVEWLDKQPQ